MNQDHVKMKMFHIPLTTKQKVSGLKFGQRLILTTLDVTKLGRKNWIKFSCCSTQQVGNSVALSDPNLDYKSCVEGGGKVISHVFCLPHSYRKDVLPHLFCSYAGDKIHSSSPLRSTPSSSSGVSLTTGISRRWKEKQTI